MVVAQQSVTNVLVEVRSPELEAHNLVVGEGDERSSRQISAELAVELGLRSNWGSHCGAIVSELVWRSGVLGAAVVDCSAADA